VPPGHAVYAEGHVADGVWIETRELWVEAGGGPPDGGADGRTVDEEAEEEGPP
jgi:hypothetical protein